MADLFSSALSGINAAQIGLATTEHNIANASTPGYSRQQIVPVARLAQQIGAGFVGKGVDVQNVKRIYDQHLSTQVLLEQSQATYLTAYYTELKQIDNLVADPTAGASPAIQSFFDAMSAISNSPESVPARQTLLGNAQFAINRFQAIDQRMTDIATKLSGQITSSISAVNTYAEQIAALNLNIRRAIATIPAQQPNDLLDQRDQLITELNREIKTTQVSQPDGTVSVFVGNGQPLVLNDQAMKLQAITSESDPSKLDIAYLRNGQTLTMQQSSIQGGNLGAYIAFRDQSLEPARNALGRVALGLATSINQQNQLGQDLNGVLGSNLFIAAVPRVIPNANNNAVSGTPGVTIANIADLTTSDYQLKFNGGTSYTLSRLSDNTVTNYASLPQTVDGMTITAPAPVTAGDTFLIRPTANGARDIALATNDPAKVAAAAPMRGTAALNNTGTARISSGTVNGPPPVNVNLQQSVSIVFDTPPTTFTVTGVGVPGSPVAGVPYTAGADITYNGWTVQITGTPATGDVFNVVSNTNATGDNRNILLMSAMQTQNLMANGTASFQGVYGQLVGDIGAKTSELSVTSLAQTNMAAQTVAAQQAVSGVNLDEEAANLIRYQKAYQAAAKAMEIASTLFDSVLAIGR
ncbi:MAG: flagellar hook-associated protein FlgK [Gallionella sp.]